MTYGHLNPKIFTTGVHKLANVIFTPHVAESGAYIFKGWYSPPNQRIGYLTVRELHSPERGIAIEWLHRQEIPVDKLFHADFNHSTVISDNTL